jgi:hypothetical protein
MKTRVIVLLLCIVAWRNPAAAQEGAGASDPLAVGIRQLEGGDLEGAIRTLDAAVKQLSMDRQRGKDLALAHVYLAMAHLGLDDPKTAKQSMLDAVRVDRDIKLDAKRFPARVRQLLDEAKQESRQAARTAPSSPSASASGPASASAAPLPPPPGPPQLARTAAPASAPASVAVGSRVRVSAPATGDKILVGTVVRSDGDALVVERENTREGITIPTTSVTKLDVSKGPASNKPMKFGILGGLLLGGTAGALYGRSDSYYYSHGCSRGSCAAKWGAIGGAGGALIGGLIGKTTGKEHWEPVSRRQVWISPIGRRGIQLALSF